MTRPIDVAGSAVAAAMREIDLWDRAARDYGIVHGRFHPNTRIQDAMRFAELRKQQFTIEGALTAYRELFEVGERLSAIATRYHIDATNLDLFLAHPNPHGRLELALVVVKRVRQVLAGTLGEPNSGLRSWNSEPRARMPKTSREEANINARAYLRDHADATARQLAEGIGCALGLVSKLAAWKAVQEEREKGRKPKPKAIRLTERMLNATGRNQQATLTALVAEQQADQEASPLDDDPRRAKVYG